jgi:hypothetical protein
MIHQDIGQTTYDAYCLNRREVGLKAPSERWQDLSADEQSCWRAAGVRAGEQVLNQLRLFDVEAHLRQKLAAAHAQLLQVGKTRLEYQEERDAAREELRDLKAQMEIDRVSRT